jgi:hypothetical protein
MRHQPDANSKVVSAPQWVIGHLYIGQLMCHARYFRRLHMVLGSDANDAAESARRAEMAEQRAEEAEERAQQAEQRAKEAEERAQQAEAHVQDLTNVSPAMQDDAEPVMEHDAEPAMGHDAAPGMSVDSYGEREPENGGPE